jgi:multidrug resistance efflux pump
MKIRFDVPPAAGQDPSGVAVRYAAARRQVPRWRWYLLLALVLAAPAYLALRFVAGMVWAQVPAVVVLEQSVVRVPAAGVLAQVPAVGAQIAAGDVVLQMQPPAVTPAPQPPAPAAMPAPAGPALAREAGLRDAVALAAQQWRLHQERLARIEALAAQAAATLPEVEAARIQALQAQGALERSRGELAEHLAVERARRLLPAALPAAAAVAAPPAAAVRAPFEARVAQVFVHAGEWQPAGADAVLLQSTAPALVQAYVDPARAARVQPGRRASLRFADGSRAPAEVVAIVAHAERVPAERVSPLAPRMPALLVKLRPLQPLPERLRIHALPLDVRFEGVW